MKRKLLTFLLVLVLPSGFVHADCWPGNPGYRECLNNQGSTLRAMQAQEALDRQAAAQEEQVRLMRQQLQLQQEMMRQQQIQQAPPGSAYQRMLILNQGFQKFNCSVTPQNCR
ncbi:MAG TPA: hypothetical protein VMR50_13835 [Myxococcota bacterium]|nr:hypothetical protein [Myxococcota bacterium]